MANFYSFTSLTGGGVGALDAINGSILTAGDIAIGATSTVTGSYILDASGDAESGIEVIAPDTNAGNLRWKRKHDETKIDVVSGATLDNVTTMTAAGEVDDSGIAIDDVVVKTGTPATADGLVYNGSLWVPSSSWNRNVLINGGFTVAQRGTSFTSATTPANSDDTYLLDRWILLSDGNDIVDVTQSTVRPDTLFSKSIALDVETVNKKFGICQIVEFPNAAYLTFGSAVTFSFYAKVSETTKLSNIKAGILAWDGVVDTVTSDVVSAWGAGGTTPTLAANWTFENVPANLNVTDSWARYSVTAALNTAGSSNIAVFIWSDVVDTTAGHFLYITGCQLENGSAATPFEYRPLGQELILCQRYYQSVSLAHFYISGLASTTMYVGGRIPVTMRASPVGSLVDVANKGYLANGAAATFDTFTVVVVGPDSYYLNLAHSAAIAGYNPVVLNLASEL